MARQLRLEFEGALYHVTARGNAFQAIYTDDHDRARFLDLLAREIAQQHWRCYAYCLMDNHYHLLLETPEPNLSQGMRRLNAVYTQGFNRRYGRVGHVLQGRYKSLLVDKDAYLLELCRYIVLNPVRAKCVARPEAWPWSSYLATAGKRPAPHWLLVTDVLGLFDREARSAQRAYREFVQRGLTIPAPWGKVRGQIFLGDEKFLSQMTRLLQAKSLTNVPMAQTRPSRPTAAEVLQRVGEVYRVPVRAILTRRNREAYHCAAWLLRREANESLQGVARLFAVSGSRISHIQRVVERGAPNRQQREARRRCKVKQ